MSDINEKKLPTDPEHECDHNCEACGGGCEECDDNLIALCDEEGNETVFEWLDTVEYEGEYYGVFIPVDEDTEDVVILHITVNEDEEEIYDGIDDEALVMKLFELFKEQNKDQFTFRD